MREIAPQPSAVVTMTETPVQMGHSSISYLCFGDSVPGQLHDGEVSLADGPLDVVEPDAYRRLLRPVRHLRV